MKQYRGCSKLYFAPITESGNTTTYGTPVALAPVKNISRTIDETLEEVWADNELQYEVDGGKAITRSFEVTNILASIEAQLMGQDTIDIGGDGLKGYSTPAFSTRPYFAFGYALHDGDPENPCEYVWAYRGKVANISQEVATIRKGDTTSTSRTIEITFQSPKNKFVATGKRNMDMNVAVVENVTDMDLTKWFDQVVTPDNASTVLELETETPTP